MWRFLGQAVCWTSMSHVQGQIHSWDTLWYFFISLHQSECEILLLDILPFASDTQTRIYALFFSSKQLPEPVGKPVSKPALSCNLMGKVLRPWQSMDNILRAWIPIPLFNYSDQFTKNACWSPGSLSRSPGINHGCIPAAALLGIALSCNLSPPWETVDTSCPEMFNARLDGALSNPV